MHAYWEDLRWGEMHHGELLKQHRDKWVAIKNKKIVACGTNLAEVRKEAIQKTGETQIPFLYIDCGEHIYG